MNTDDKEEIMICLKVAKKNINEAIAILKKQDDEQSGYTAQHLRSAISDINNIIDGLGEL